MRISERELEQFKADVDARKKKIEALEKRRNGIRNFRYVLDMDFPAVGFASDRDNPPHLPPRRASAVVDRATRFYVKRIESVLQVVGTNSSGLSATVVIPPPMRERACTFEYKVRDTGSDRNWQNDWLPYSLTLGGNLRGIGFKKAHAVLSGGAEIVLDVRGQVTAPSAAFLGFTAVSKWSLSFCFIGVEVPA